MSCADEDEAHANKENAAPSTIEKTIQQATFVADTPAAPVSDTVAFGF